MHPLECKECSLISQAFAKGLEGNSRQYSHFRSPGPHSLGLHTAPVVALYTLY